MSGILGIAETGGEAGDIITVRLSGGTTASLDSSLSGIEPGWIVTGNHSDVSDMHVVPATSKRARVIYRDNSKDDISVHDVFYECKNHTYIRVYYPNTYYDFIIRSLISTGRSSSKIVKYLRLFGLYVYMQ